MTSKFLGAFTAFAAGVTFIGALFEISKNDAGLAALFTVLTFINLITAWGNLHD